MRIEQSQTIGLATVFDSPAFDDMLLKVANDDVVSFKNNNQWLIHHPSEALIFKSLDSIWDELSRVYNEDFRNLVYGGLPSDQRVFDTLKKIKDRIISITWTIEMGT